VPGRTQRAPNGIRTRAAALKGRCPRPLDDGGSTDIAALPVAPAVGDRPSIGDERHCRQSGRPPLIVPPPVRPPCSTFTQSPRRDAVGEPESGTMITLAQQRPRAQLPDTKAIRSC
jgi:hypothetical protein